MANISLPEITSARLAFSRLDSIPENTPGYYDTWLILKRDIRAKIEGIEGGLTKEDQDALLSKLALSQTLDNPTEID